MSAGARRAAGAWGLALGALAVAPAPAFAHGLVARQDLPVPAWLSGWAAGLVLVASFAALGSLWRRPKLQDAPTRRLLRLPWGVDLLAGLVGIALFVLVVYAGLAGVQAANGNIAPTAIYVAFWVGLPLASVLLGDVFRALNPWLALARGVAWAARRLSRGPLPEPLAYPARLGVWPAVLGVAAFTWLELAEPNRDDPSLLAGLALGYAAVQLVGMSLFGIEQWSRRADAFGVYFGLYASLAPLGRRGRDLVARRPLAGAAGLPVVAGTVALLCVAIGSTSFDGFSAGPTWGRLAPGLQGDLQSLGLSAPNAGRATATLGLLGAIALVALLYCGAAGAMRWAANTGPSAGRLAGRFAHSLIPIALAYVLAHYFSLVAFQGQALAGLASDPLGRGSDLFGTRTAAIDYTVVSSDAIWFVQVGALLVGHVAGLALAHDRALAVYRDPRAATRSQLPMLGVMVAFTSLALWLLASLD